VRVREIKTPPTDNRRNLVHTFVSYTKGISRNMILRIQSKVHIYYRLNNAVSSSTPADFIDLLTDRLNDRPLTR